MIGLALQRAARHAALVVARRDRKVVAEELERRQFLAGNVFISEFLADNSKTLLDQDGAASDWIELHNPTSSPVNLDGYFLTDKKTQLNQWRLPAVTLAPNGYMVVFASSKNRATPGQELHTNFALSKGGEYLALTAPDGTTVLSAFDPQFPAQTTDVSYGTPVTITNLISTGAASRTLVPTAAVSSSWTDVSFPGESSWTGGTTGVGYHTTGGYAGLLGTNVQSAMLNKNASALIRIPFNVVDPAAFDALTLRMRYNDGFVAYLNGVEVARRNAPATLAYNSTATTTGPAGTGTPEDFDISSTLSALRAGANVLAIQGLNASAASTDFLLSPELLGLKTAGNPVVSLASPTPGAINADGFRQTVADTKFDHDRGLYDAAFDLAITTTTPGATIRYTLDGSAPSATAGTVYSGPIRISTTTTVRAMAYQTGYASTNVDTQTYLFPTDVIRQPAGIPGVPTSVYDAGNGFSAPQDTAMDQNVVNDPKYSAAILAGLRGIPTMSIVAKGSDVWGATGFMDGAEDRPGSVEYIDPTHPEDNFQIDAAVDLHSHLRLKQSINVKFKSGFGPSKLTSDILRNSPLNGDSATNKFDKLVLRAGNNRAWSRAWNPDATTFTEDQWFRDSDIALTGTGSHGTFVQLYINGVYWGLYNTVESPNDAWDASYYGGEKEGWFSVSHDGPDDGDPTRWNYLTGPLADKDMTVAANYDELKQYLDVTDFSDYLLLAWYQGTTDWPSNNWWAGMRNDVPGPARFAAWDGEWSWDRSRSGAPINGAWVPPEFRTDSGDPAVISTLWRTARKNSDFLTLFADRVYRATANNGALTDQNSIARWDALANSVKDAVVAESARWGDALASLGQPTRTRDVDWQNEVDKIRSIMVGNATRLITALRGQGYYPSIDPASMSRQGGVVPLNYKLTLANPNAGGTVYYTTDGSDPRLSGGGISPAAKVYNAAGITISADMPVNVRVLTGATTWSALNQAAFTVTTQNTPPVVIAGNPQAITFPANAVALAGSVTDDGLPVGGSLTTGWTKVSGPGTVTFGNASSPTTSATFSSPGSYLLRLTANDGSASATSDVTITVNPAAGAPVVSSLVLINTDTQQAVPGVVLTPNAANTLNLATLPARVSLQALTNPGTVGSVVFGYDAANTFRVENTAPYFFNGDYVPFSFTTGDHIVTVTAFSGTGGSGLSSLATTFSLTLINQPPTGNQAPTVNAGASQAITLPGTVTLAGSATDDGLPTGGTLATTWSKLSGPGTVTFGNAAALNSSASFSTAGTYVLRLSANDGALTSTSDVTITVNPAGTPGPAIAGLLIINADTQLPVPGIVLTPGVANALNLATLPPRITLQATTDPALVGSVRFGYDANASFRVETAAPYFFNGDYVPFTFTTGNHTVSVTAFTGAGATGTAGTTLSFPLVITNNTGGTNQAPTVNAGSGQTISLPATVSLAGTAGDDGLPNGSTLTTTWSKFSGPGTVTFANAALLNTTASFSAAGTYVLRLTASDGTLASTSDVTIIVNPAGTGPTIATLRIINTATQQPVPGITLVAGVTNTLDLATLPANFTFEALTSPTTVGSVRFGYDGNANFRVETAAPYFFNGDYVPYAFTTGNHTVTATAFTGAGATGTAGATVSFPLVITRSTGGTNQAPSVSAGSNQGITLPGSITLAGSAGDDGLPAGGTLTTTWSKFSGPGTVTFGNAAALNSSASFSTAGTYVLRLTANDGALTSTSDITITVNPISQTGPEVTSFVLIDTDTQQPVPGVTLVPGVTNTLNRAALPARISLQVLTAAGSPVGSVRFGYDGNTNFRTENTAPWFFNGDYVPFTFAPGTHAVTATAYTGTGATGTAGATLTLLLNVI